MLLNIKSLISIPLLMLSISIHCGAAEVGKVTHLSGILTVARADGDNKILSINSAIFDGDALRTEEDTYARLKFNDNAEIVLRPETNFKVNQHTFNPEKPENNKSDMELIKGGMRAVTGLIGKNNHDAVRVGTPTATIGIRGTHFGLLYCQDNCGSVPTPSGQMPVNGLHADVVDGGISISNQSGTTNLSAGQFGYVRDLNTPPVQVPPSQSVQVTMPPAISQNNSQGQGIGKAKDTECTIQ
jgi:hypothetical protein